eukprot:SAG31_NODE_73_length_27793_cov_26.900520_23_plen_105_part_00
MFVQGTNAKIHRRFDLKGSSHGRNASDAEKRKGSAATLKCNDFREMRLKTGRKIRTGENKESILKALKDGESGRHFANNLFQTNVANDGNCFMLQTQTCLRNLI